MFDLKSGHLKTLVSGKPMGMFGPTVFNVTGSCFRGVGAGQMQLSVRIDGNEVGATLGYQLLWAYRRFPRLSSPLDAKTSTVRP